MFHARLGHPPGKLTREGVKMAENAQRLRGPTQHNKGKCLLKGMMNSTGARGRKPITEGQVRSGLQEGTMLLKSLCRGEKWNEKKVYSPLENLRSERWRYLQVKKLNKKIGSGEKVKNHPTELSVVIKELSTGGGCIA